MPRISSPPQIAKGTTPRKYHTPRTAPGRIEGTRGKWKAEEKEQGQQEAGANESPAPIPQGYGTTKEQPGSLVDTFPHWKR